MMMWLMLTVVRVRHRVVGVHARDEGARAFVAHIAVHVAALSVICSSAWEGWSAGERVEVVEAGDLAQGQCWELVFEESVGLADVGCASRDE